MKPWSIVYTVLISMKAHFYVFGWLTATAVIGYGQTKLPDMKTQSTPLVCKLTSAEMQTRKATVIAELKSLVLEKTELENGFEYTFSGSDTMLDKLTDFIKTEKLCCDFFVFQLTVAQDVVLLRITGPEGVKQFIRQEVEW